MTAHRARARRPRRGVIGAAAGCQRAGGAGGRRRPARRGGPSAADQRPAAEADRARGRQGVLPRPRPEAAGLTLMLKGAPLQRFTVLGLQVGHPRAGWISRRDPRHVQSVIWSGGELDPPRQIDRLVIQAAEPGKEAPESTPPPIPPTPEELYPVPSRYHVQIRGRALGGNPAARGRHVGRAVGALPRRRGREWHDIISALRSLGARCDPAAHHAGPDGSPVVLSFAAAGRAPHRARRRGGAAAAQPAGEDAMTCRLLSGPRRRTAARRPGPGRSHGRPPGALSAGEVVQPVRTSVLVGPSAPCWA